MQRHRSSKTLIWVTSLSTQGTVFSAVKMRRALHCSTAGLPDVEASSDRSEAWLSVSDKEEEGEAAAADCEASTFASGKEEAFGATAAADAEAGVVAV